MPCMKTPGYGRVQRGLPHKRWHNCRSKHTPFGRSPHTEPVQLSRMYTLAPDISLVKSLLEFACVDVVLGLRYRKVMVTRKIIFCTHINIIVLLVVQYSIYRCNTWHHDRARRQPTVKIRVVRGIG